MPEYSIINRGRGPELSSVRLTVYDIWDYARVGWHHSKIAALFRISSAEVEVALKYIEEHKAEVLAQYEKILERSARGNPPEIQAKLAESRQKFQEHVAKIRAGKNGENGSHRSTAAR